MSDPTFSVILPTYHRNELLAKCLDCLKPGVQTLSAGQYEVIVTDDGRTTTAEQLIQEQYPWVQWVAGPCKGPAANRNNGAKFAQGEWLVFTDDDCIPEACWLETYHDAITLDIDVYEGKTTCSTGIYSPLHHAPVNESGGYLWSCNMMIHKNLYESINGFDENFIYAHMEDVDLRDQIKARNKAILFLKYAVVDHPPKRLPWGVQIAKLHESEVYYYKKNNLPLSTLNFIAHITRFRLINIKKYCLQPDSFLAIISLSIEVFYTLKKIEIWKRRYASKVVSQNF